MLTAEDVDGESATAIENAEKILAAETAANKAVMDADDALKDAEAVLVKAKALPEDDAERAGAITAAERAVEEAKAQKAAAQEILDENPVDSGTTTPTTAVDSLKEAVAAVKGSNRLADDYPMMPAAIGKRIATEVGTAIGNLSDLSTPGTITAGTTPMVGIKNDAEDIGAMTWAMIVGEDNVMMKRLGTIDGTSGTHSPGNQELSVASLTGMTATDVLPSGTVLATAGANLAITANGSYKGIPGAIFCLGGDDGCKVTGTGDAAKLGAGWYFSPNSPMTLYVADPDEAGSYEAATLYATYGYWLTYTDPAGAVDTVVLHSATTAPSTHE